jgi:prepilin-type N-terminal cleavage/methylation domain-containing protein
MTKEQQNGFTLIELAISITIIGFMIAGTLLLINPILQITKKNETEKKMERIIDVLSIYTQRNNRVPCPANPNQAIVVQPFGAEVGSGGAGTNIGNCTGAGALIEGIVPYKTIGLSEADIIDGWGNYFTYRVAPTYTRNTALALNVHARCRTDITWIDDTTALNRNPPKAKFCCADDALAANDLVIRDENNTLIWAFPRDNANYANENTSVPTGTVFTPDTNNITMPAFLLISHGKNGFGAFLRTGARLAALGQSGDDETENQDGDDNYVIGPTNRIINNTYFDDIVSWRTQEQLYSETGEGSCIFP